MKLEIPLMIDDRRRYQRIEIALEGLASFGESERVEVAAENLSPKGVCFSTFEVAGQLPISVFEENSNLGFTNRLTNKPEPKLGMVNDIARLIGP